MLKITIRKNATGETRTYQEETVWHDGLDHLWSDGNYGCDCNRRLFFDRAGGEESEESWGVDCSEGKYSAEISNETGVVFSDLRRAPLA